MQEELDQVSRFVDVTYNFLINYSFQMLGAIIIVLIGLFVASKVSNLVMRLLTSRNVDITLSRFAAGGVKIVIVAGVAIIALGKIGISITPFVAAIGALSLGVGLALQGLLSNYGAGVSIVVTRPFVVGDTITIQGVTGIVQEVHLANTVLSNEDEVRITIPNKHIIGEIIQNSGEHTVVELQIGIAYHCDPALAIKTIETALGPLEGLSTKKSPQVGVDKFGDSSIDIGIRFWTKTDLYFQNKYAANLAIFSALGEKNIDIPFPQREVRLVEKTS